jgi:hypothetical protein
MDDDENEVDRDHAPIEPADLIPVLGLLTLGEVYDRPSEDVVEQVTAPGGEAGDGGWLAQPPGVRKGHGLADNLKAGQIRGRERDCDCECR